MGAAHFGTLYLREIETPSWSEFANDENTYRAVQQTTGFRNESVFN